MGPGSSILGAREVIATEVKEVVDLIVGREETLCLPGRLEPLHLPFSSSGRLVRVLRPVVQTLVLPVLNTGHDFPLCGPIAAQLVGNQETG